MQPTTNKERVEYIESVLVNVLLNSHTAPHLKPHVAASIKFANELLDQLTLGFISTQKEIPEPVQDDEDSSRNFWNPAGNEGQDDEY